jgi:transposase
MGWKKRQFTTEFKAEAVGLVESGKSLREVAGDLGVSRAALRNWVKRALDGNKKGLGLTEREELERLRREVAQLRLERDLLKKAAAFFAKESQ